MSIKIGAKSMGKTKNGYSKKMKKNVDTPKKWGRSKCVVKRKKIEIPSGYITRRTEGISNE